MPASNDFIQLLDQLKDLQRPFSTKDLYRLSDLSQADLAALEAAWPEAPLERRRAIMADLGEIGEANLEVQFDAVYRLGLEDEDAEIRANAITNLWESEEPALIAPFLDLLQHDADEAVRAAAASALGRFVYLGEIDEIPKHQARRIEDGLLAVIGGADTLDVRRRALEAISFSGRPEVPDLIDQAYASPERPERISALFAMGRSADERWNAPVLRELESGDPELRYEAARAAGELELSEAVPALKQMINDGEVQVREAAIWSLGQIGGDQARQILLDLLQEAADDERDFIDDALENLTLHDESLGFPLLDMTDDELDALLAEDEDEDDEPGPGDPLPPVHRLN